MHPSASTMSAHCHYPSIASFERDIPLSFAKLRSLYVATYDISDKVIDFVCRNGHLQRLQFAIGSPAYHQLRRILDTVPGLAELAAPLERGANGACISMLLTDARTRLKRVTVTISP